MSVAAAIAATIALPSAAQQNWVVDPSIYVGVNHSDNSRLAFDSQGGNSETSYEVSPRLSINRNGSRWSLSSNYRLQARFYNENNDEDTVFHYLNANSSLWLVENTAGVNMTANISQQIIDPSRPVSLTTATRSGNRTESGTYGVEPFVNLSLGDNTRGRVSYRYALVEYDEPLLSDSKEGRAVVALSTAIAGSAWSFAAYLSNADIEYDTGRDITLTRISGDVGYRIAPRSDFVITVGRDENDLGSLPFVRDVDGSFWMAGFRGSLSDTTTYEVRAGEQFYGDSYLLRFDRSKGRVVLGIAYEEETTTRGRAQLDYESILSFITSITGISQPAITQDVYVTKRFSVNGTYTLPKSAWRLSLFDNRRDFLTMQDATGNDSSVGIGLRWTWEASSKTRIAASVNWVRFEPRAGGEEPKDLRFDASWRRNLFDQGYVTARYRHNQRGSSGPANEYEENVISVGVGYDF